MKSFCGCLICIALALTLFAAPATAGQLRIEGSAMKIFDSKSRKLGEDYYGVIAEYEIPMSQRLALGLRFEPLFVYPTDGHSLHNDSGSDLMYGTALGVAARLYQHDQKGLFIEGSLSALWHTNEFLGDTSKLDFMTEGGIGYQFLNFFLTLKVEHISNAGLHSENSGVNALGLGAGFRF